MNTEAFIRAAVRMIIDYYAEHLGHEIAEDMVYVVWYAKVLQNSKALLSTIIKDTRYFEITYNGDKKEFYLDAYQKERNILIETDEPPALPKEDFRGILDRLQEGI